MPGTEIVLAAPINSIANVERLFDERSRELASVMPSWSPVTAMAVMQKAVELCQANEYLLKMSAGSLLGSVKRACEFGLSLAPELGQAYIVPRKGKACLDIGYRGMLALVNRSVSGCIVDAQAVFKGDKYERAYGESLHHEPTGDVRDKESLVCTYAVARWPDGRIIFAEMNKAELMAIMGRSESVKQANRKNVAYGSPWFSDPVAMCVKTAVRKLWKMLPASVEYMDLVQRVIAHDNTMFGLDTGNGATTSPCSRLEALRQRTIGKPAEPQDVVDVSEEGEPEPQPVAATVEDTFESALQAMSDRDCGGWKLAKEDVDVCRKQLWAARKPKNALEAIAALDGFVLQTVDNGQGEIVGVQLGPKDKETDE